jgi:hypothetical protein
VFTLLRVLLVLRLSLFKLFFAWVLSELVCVIFPGVLEHHRVSLDRQIAYKPHAASCKPHLSSFSVLAGVREHHCVSLKHQLAYKPCAAPCKPPLGLVWLDLSFVSALASVREHHRVSLERQLAYKPRAAPCKPHLGLIWLLRFSGSFLVSRLYPLVLA